MALKYYSRFQGNERLFMINTDFIDDLVKRLSNAIPPNVQNIKKDVEHNFHAVLQSAFAKLDLVTREEFDAQIGVLAKTRQKLTELERQVIHLEAKLAESAPRQTTKK